MRYCGLAVLSEVSLPIHTYFPLAVSCGHPLAVPRWLPISLVFLMLLAFGPVVTSRDGTGLDYEECDVEYYYADPQQGFKHKRMRG